MAQPTPVSSSITTTTAATSTDPISPVSRTATFPHKTSPAVATQTPLIDTSTPAINAAPVELDGLCVGKIADTQPAGRISSPAAAEEEKRSEMLASRSKDLGVIVDVPRFPTAEEVLAAKSADGTVTPGMEVGR
ncbi:hypothetical protein BDU57DRAFT_543015 [Ampelomyces quisqualis]|uniref:SMP domain-containing protein n=1 Tax=Ampelomyces quisqualis TaxID=50730 RepID=A0A6A5QAH2_AMPQU|nr:hypothetical protein BDU57DRAFT_543015 [Ampelomyces quisqualis]